MRLRKINYGDLSGRQKEAFNFQKVAGLLAEYGYNCIKLADDSKGADFLAFHADGTTLKVQLKSRLTISRKYGSSIYMAFPVRGDWYLVRHDALVRLVGKHTEWLESSSWIEGRLYSSGKPKRELVDALSRYRLELRSLVHQE